MQWFWICRWFHSTHHWSGPRPLPLPFASQASTVHLCLRLRVEGHVTALALILFPFRARLDPPTCIRERQITVTVLALIFSPSFLSQARLHPPPCLEDHAYFSGPHPPHRPLASQASPVHLFERLRVEGCDHVTALTLGISSTFLTRARLHPSACLHCDHVTVLPLLPSSSPARLYLRFFSPGCEGGGGEGGRTGRVEGVGCRVRAGHRPIMALTASGGAASRFPPSPSPGFAVSTPSTCPPPPPESSSFSSSFLSA